MQTENKKEKQYCGPNLNGRGGNSAVRRPKCPRASQRRARAKKKKSRQAGPACRRLSIAEAVSGHGVRRISRHKEDRAAGSSSPTSRTRKELGELARPRMARGLGFLTPGDADHGGERSPVLRTRRRRAGHLQEADPAGTTCTRSYPRGPEV